MPSSTSSSEATPKAGAPIALVAALLAFFVSENAVWRYRPWLELCARYTPPDGPGDPLRTSARIGLLPTHDRQPPILLIGSSQVLEGLDCGPFEERFPGRTCGNLGVAGGSPLDVLFLADEVDSRLKRRTIVTGFFPHTLHRTPKAAFSDLATLRCLFAGGAWLHMDATEWIEAIYGQLQNASETLRNKDALLWWWSIVSEDPGAALRLEMPPQPQRRLEGRPPRRPSYFRQRMGVVNPDIAPGRFTAAHEAALEALIEREGRRGNKIVVVDFPTRSGYDTTITPEAVEHHERLFERLSSRPDVLVVRRAELPPLEDDDFYDFTHVRASGRAKISERLAELVFRAGD
jgi:hypothetical protein